jgi:hypothetical protein
MHRRSCHAVVWRGGPSFDDNSSFLWLLGLSHAAYLAYKAPTKKPA